MVVHFFKTSLIAVSVLALTACGAPSAPPPGASDIEKEEQSIYDVLFRESTGSVLILQYTSTGFPVDASTDLIRNNASGLNGISQKTIDSFLQRNTESVQIPSGMQIGVDYIILSQEELVRISSQQNWGEALHEKYNTGGYWILSRVGFNNSFDQALVYAGFVGGPLAGTGYYYLMEKQDGQWVIKEKSMVWIS